MSFSSLYFAKSLYLRFGSIYNNPFSLLLFALSDLPEDSSDDDADDDEEDDVDLSSVQFGSRYQWHKAGAAFTVTGMSVCIWKCN